MNITLINPNNVTQKGDFFGTGIPYIPIVLASLAAYLHEKKHSITFIDAFGEDPWKKQKEGNFIIAGLNEHEISERVPKETDLICIYAGHVVEHSIILKILKELKNLNIPICMIENSQAVTAYSLKIAHKEFMKAGADYIVCGEPEKTVEQLLKKGMNHSHVKGLIYSHKNKIQINKNAEAIENLDELPFPAWDMVPIINYWRLGYSHAPFQGKYIPLLTSRGCPYECEFCIIPYTNRRLWRSRSAQNVVHEIIYWNKKYGVTDFHIEDLNPTINKKRIQDISRLIIEKKLKIKLKCASGIKLETLDKETLSLFAKAGCNYISFSPESGSERMLKLMKKQFNYKHGLEMTKLMHKLRIKTQACFVIGFSGETDKDREYTKKYIIELTKKGIDEIALFMMTPIPGSKPYEHYQHKPEELSKLTFSPHWRKEYKKLNKFRRAIYFTFILYKLLYHPLKLLKQPFSLIRRKFDTKMEMTIYRLLKTYF
jgi:radical SAM superfamily enzyme YgiQ (UPF0313 family)